MVSALPRSGGNHLSALLALHPDCRPSRVPEDFFLANSAMLVGYCDAVSDSWTGWWRQRLGGAARLAESVGAALMRFADPEAVDDDEGARTRVVLRSPTIEGIENAFFLFPDAQILILVRDGPDTVESGRRSFGWGYDDAIRAWRRAARRLLSFVDNADPRRCRLVRFEDVVADPVREMSKIVDFLGLDVRRYPFQRVGSVPVIGSSTFGRPEGEPIDWGPVPKTGEFDPLSRARDWPLWRHKRAAWIAAAERRRLGYPAPSLPARDWLLNLTMDFVHCARRAACCIGRIATCRPRLFSGRQGLYLTLRHICKNL